MSWPCGRRLPVADGPFPWSASRVRLMNSTPAEFRRALFAAFADAVSEDDAGLLVADGDVCLHFVLTSEAPRRIGALQLSVLRVEIAARQGTDEAVAKLLARIDRATQRGGG
jgi:hypothetical protein